MPLAELKGRDQPQLHKGQPYKGGTVTQRRTVTILSDFLWKLQIPRCACQVRFQVDLFVNMFLSHGFGFLPSSLFIINSLFLLPVLSTLFFQLCALLSRPAVLIYLQEVKHLYVSHLFSLQLLSRTFSLLFIASFFTEPRFHQPTGHKTFTVCCKCL